MDSITEFWYAVHQALDRGAVLKFRRMADGATEVVAEIGNGVSCIVATTKRSLATNVNRVTQGAVDADTQPKKKVAQ